MLVLVILVVGRAFRACSADNDESSCAFAFSSIKVVDLIDAALISANSFVDVVDLTFGTFGAEVVDEVESRLADASVS